MMGISMLGVLLCGLSLPILLGGAYLLLRLGRGPAPTDARAVLDERLARGEIGTDAYLEVESALRSGQPARRRRR